MFGVLGLFALVGLGYLTASIARERGIPSRSRSATPWRAAAGIAVVRLAILWGGGTLLLGAELIRPLRFIVLVLVIGNSVVELAISKALTYRLLESLFGDAGTLSGASIGLAALTIVTSIPLGFAWALVRSQPRSGSAP